MKVRGDHLYVWVIMEITHFVYDWLASPSGLNNAGITLFPLRSQSQFYLLITDESL